MAPYRSAHRDHGTGPALCRRHSVEHHGLGTRHGPLAAEAYGQAAGGRPSACAATPSISRSRSKALRSACRPEAWRTITWREGTNEPLTSRFARLRIRIAHRDFDRSEPWPEEWLLIEWPKGEKEPTKYWLSTLPQTIGFARLVDLAKLRWRIERDYQELKQELGLGHFEGRGWRGFHHHATLCIAAYGFLISERETIPPSAARSRPAASRNLPFPQVIDPEAPPLRPERHIPNSIATMRRRLIDALVHSFAAMSLLPRSHHKTQAPKLVTQ